MSVHYRENYVTRSSKKFRYDTFDMIPFFIFTFSCYLDTKIDNTVANENITIAFPHYSLIATYSCFNRILLHLHVIGIVAEHTWALVVFYGV